MINIRFPRAFRDRSDATASSKFQWPSAEEIQAAVRKVIYENGGSKPKEDAVPSPTPEKKSSPATKSDVLELTDMVEEGGSVTKHDKGTSAPAAKNPPPNSSKPQVDTEQPLLSEEAAAASFGSLAQLAGVVARREMPQGDAPLTASSRTLESLVAELLRPTLREWLDKNLASIIDRMVRREIEKLIRRTEDPQSPAESRWRSLA